MQQQDKMNITLDTKMNITLDTKMNITLDTKAILIELNRDKENELVPIYGILGFLMAFGIVGNALILIFIWHKAGRCIASFFIQVLALTDTLVCLTISLVILEFNKTYIFDYGLLCKLYVFTKFFVALFSGFVLVTIAAYRYRKICRPLKDQLSLKGARITVICLFVLVLVLSFPQFLFANISSIEIPNDYNVTILGSECTLRAVQDTNLQWFQTILEGIYVFIFLCCSTVLIILYTLQARSILKLNTNLAKFKYTREHSNASNTTCKSMENLCKISDTMKKSNMDLPTLTNAKQNNQFGKEKQDNRDQESSVSSTKITIMFFVIALGFIVSYLPYLTYSVWRTFTPAPPDIVLQGTAPLNVFCLNSYLINSTINSVIYGIFHYEFRQFLKSLIICCR